METKIRRGSADIRPVRLRLILVHAVEVRGAESWLGPLKNFRDSDQSYPWMPRQNTESLLLWAYAADGDSRPFLWLGPKSKDDGNEMAVRHWLINKVVPTFPLPGIFFFDAWRIRPGLEIPLKFSAGLTAVDLTHDEEMPQEPEAQDTRHVDRLIRRQEVLTAQSDAKTVADCAMEVSYVMQLSQALLEAGDILEESTTARHRYLDVQREPEALAQQGGNKRRATGTTRTRAPDPAELAPIATLSHEGSPELPRRVVDNILGNLQHLPDSWPLIRFDLMLHKSANYYAIWRRFLRLNEYLRNFTPDTANATIDAHARGLTEHLVQFLAEWIIMALEPARVITKVRAPDFLFLHDKDFWFKQIWVDLHQTMVLDRQVSYTRPVIGLVRCVCKDETEQTGRASPIKMRICNLHFFAPIWMAQPIVHNFRRMSMADLKPREPGFFDYKEGWHEWDGKGKHEEEAFAGHTMGCIRLMVTDNNVEPFHYHNWGPIEHFAVQGVIKDSIWLARMGCLGLKARVDIPVAGTMINVVNDRLSVEHPPNGWPINAESGWQEYHNKAEQTFEVIVAELANSRFNKTVFEGTATAQAFEWDIAMESKWPVHQDRLSQKWNNGTRTQGVARSGRNIAWHEWQEMFRSLTHSQHIGLVQSAYVACLMRGDDTKLVPHQHRILYERQNAAAQLGMHMYGFRVILKNTFAPGDLDTVINQLVFRSQGNLEQFVDDRDLFIRVVGEIMTEFNMQQPPSAHAPQGSGILGSEDPEGDNKWIRIFWGREHVGPEDRDQWRDHDM